MSTLSSVPRERMKHIRSAFSPVQGCVRSRTSPNTGLGPIQQTIDDTYLLRSLGGERVLTHRCNVSND